MCTQTVPYINLCPQNGYMSQTRDEYIKIYLSEEEKEQVRNKAERENMSTSTLGRRKLLQGEQAWTKTK